MSRQVGVAQKRALTALANARDGIGEVPLLSAPGLINKGLVRRIRRVSQKSNAAYLCQITEGGRQLAKVLAEDVGVAGDPLLTLAA